MRERESTRRVTSHHPQRLHFGGHLNSNLPCTCSFEGLGFRVQGSGLTISVECPNPRTGKHGKINIILNPKPAEKEFGFMNLFTRKSEGGAKNSGMSSLRSAGLFRTLSQESATLAKRRSGASNLPFCQQPPKLNKIRLPS